MKIHKNQSGIAQTAIIVLVVLVAGLGFAGWRVYEMQKQNNNSKKAASHPDVVKTKENKEVQKQSYQGQTVASSKGRFTIAIPQGWNELLRPMDGDMLILPGSKQPTYSSGKQVNVKDMPSYGTDSGSLFTAIVHNNIADPEGTASEFTLPNAGQPIQGKKYAVTYTDTADGLGGHQKGEIRYQYWFKLKDGNNLVVWYNVYIDDLKDQSSLVDEVVRSIIVKN